MTTPRRSTRSETPSPVDMPGGSGGTRAGLGWTTLTIAIASLFLLLTNAQALDGWAAEQEPSETMVRVTDATAGWLATTDRMGASAPRAWLHGLWKRAQAVRFAGQPPAEP
jgi:hypothetical protein